jgi:hypothetical protein
MKSVITILLMVIVTHGMIVHPGDSEWRTWGMGILSLIAHRNR